MRILQALSQPVKLQALNIGLLRLHRAPLMLQLLLQLLAPLIGMVTVTLLVGWR